MVEWWNGGMVEWWDGGMVEWWNGGMVEWWNGGMVLSKYKILTLRISNSPNITNIQISQIFKYHKYPNTTNIQAFFDVKFLILDLCSIWCPLGE